MIRLKRILLTGTIVPALVLAPFAGAFAQGTEQERHAPGGGGGHPGGPGGGAPGGGHEGGPRGGGAPGAGGGGAAHAPGAEHAPRPAAATPPAAHATPTAPAPRAERPAPAEHAAPAAPARAQAPATPGNKLLGLSPKTQPHETAPPAARAPSPLGDRLLGGNRAQPHDTATPNRAATPDAPTHASPSAPTPRNGADPAAAGAPHHGGDPNHPGRHGNEPGANPATPNAAAPAANPAATAPTNGGPNGRPNATGPNGQRPDGFNGQRQGGQRPDGQRPDAANGQQPNGANAQQPNNGQRFNNNGQGNGFNNGNNGGGNNGERRGGISPGGAAAIGAAAGFAGGFLAATAASNLDGIRRDRREVVEDGRTYIREPGRTIVEDGDRSYIVHDENDRFRDLGYDVHRERRGSDFVDTIDRPDGTQILTYTTPDGRMLRRVRRYRDGREFVLIDNSYNGGVRSVQEDIVVLPPPPMGIPRDRYDVAYQDADEGLIYDTFTAPPLQAPPRRYTLDQIRYSPDVRRYVRSVDINTINFDSGSWTVPASATGKLRALATAVQRTIAKDPNSVFLVQGYTDATGNPTDNLSLSDRRAQSVASILSKDFGIPPENLTTQGYGQQNLKENTQGPSAANRRVVIQNITPLLAAGGQPPQ